MSDARRLLTAMTARYPGVRLALVFLVSGMGVYLLAAVARPAGGAPGSTGNAPPHQPVERKPPAAGERNELVRRLRLLRVGRKAPSDRGGVGAGRARQRRTPVRLGELPAGPDACGELRRRLGQEAQSEMEHASRIR